MITYADPICAQFEIFQLRQLFQALDLGDLVLNKVDMI